MFKCSTKVKAEFNYFKRSLLNCDGLYTHVLSMEMSNNFSFLCLFYLKGQIIHRQVNFVLYIGMFQQHINHNSCVTPNTSTPRIYKRGLGFIIYKRI